MEKQTKTKRINDESASISKSCQERRVSVCESVIPGVCLMCKVCVAPAGELRHVNDGQSGYFLLFFQSFDYSRKIIETQRVSSPTTGSIEQILSPGIQLRTSFIIVNEKSKNTPGSSYQSVLKSKGQEKHYFGLNETIFERGNECKFLYLIETFLLLLLY